MEATHPSDDWNDLDGDDLGPPPSTRTALLMWHLALALRAAHQRDVIGSCACGKSYPCQDRRLAEYGFLAAGGLLTWPPFLGAPPPVTVSAGPDA